MFYQVRKSSRHSGISSEQTRTPCRVAGEDGPMIKVKCNDMHATGAQEFVILLHPTRVLPFVGLKGEMYRIINS